MPNLRPRVSHTATLLADGRVLLSDGTSVDRQQAGTAEIFDPQTNKVIPLIIPLPDDGGIPSVTETIPARNATDVPVDTAVTLRFSHPIAITALEQRVLLSGSLGAVSSRVIPAEGGRLVFVRPLDQLAPDTTYTILLSLVTDEAGASVVIDPWTFTTSKSSTRSPVDSQVWRPDAIGSSGWRTNLPPSPWQQLKPLQAPPGTTALAGQVLGINGVPIAGVTLDVEGHTSTGLADS